MQTKSNIQLIRESLAIRDAFKGRVKSIMEEYTVEDSFFYPSRHEYSLAEHVNGYFACEHEYTNLDEAVSNMSLQHTLRVIDNKRFQIGIQYDKLSDAHGEKIIDITTGLNINDR